MPRISYLLLASAASGLLTALAALACGDTAATTSLAPVTGIVLRVESLISGFGCGTGPAEVYRYAAVVTDSTGQHLAAATYDCFADGSFVNLTVQPDGGAEYTVQVYAFNQAAYIAADVNNAVEKAVANLPASLGALKDLHPTWQTTCTASQLQNVQTLAVCAPLTLVVTTAVRIETAQFSTSSGTDAKCAIAGGTFSSVRAFFSIGDAGTTPDGEAGTSPRNPVSDASVTVACPDPIRIVPALAPAAYTFDLHLLRSSAADGGPEAGADAGVVEVEVGTTTCRATSKVGVEVVADCDPVK